MPAASQFTITIGEPIPMPVTAVADAMSPKERIKAINEGKPYDRIPVNPSLGEHAALVLGISVSEYNRSATKMAEAQIAAYRLYGHDGVGVGPGSTAIAGAIGSRVIYPDDSTGYIADYPVKTAGDFERLILPDPYTSGQLAIYLEAAAILVREVGDEVPVGFTIGGPVTIASKIRGIDNLLRDFYKNKELAHKLLNFSVESTLPLVREAAKSGVGFGIADPVASGSLISKAHFREFALPYQKLLIDGIKAVAPAPELHICGDTKHLLELMADSGARSLSLDNAVDLEFAKRTVGERVRITGNIRPTETMVLGTPDTVEENVKENLRKAYDSPKGYLLRMGCGLPINARPENIHALVAAARTYGRYPYDPELFA